MRSQFLVGDKRPFVFKLPNLNFNCLVIDVAAITYKLGTLSPLFGLQNEFEFVGAVDFRARDLTKEQNFVYFFTNLNAILSTSPIPCALLVKKSSVPYFA